MHLPSLYQTTAFGLTGLATTDMLVKLTPHPPPLIFIDTLYHFPETLELMSDVKQKYGSEIHVFKPDGCGTVEAFEARHGPRLWEVADVVYDYLVKVRIIEGLGVFINSPITVRSSRLPERIPNWAYNLL